MEDNLKLKVVQELNAELGNDVANLSKCHDIYKRLLEEKDAIEKKVKCSSVIQPFFHNIMYHTYPFVKLGINVFVLRSTRI
jgi:hypothetical protein